MGQAVLHHLLHGAVLGKALSIPAPHAVLLIEAAVCVFGQDVIVQRHSTALADQGPGTAQQGVDGHAEQP